LLTSYFGYTWLTKPSEQQPREHVYYADFKIHYETQIRKYGQNSLLMTFRVYPFVAFQSEHDRGLLVDGLLFTDSYFGSLTEQQLNSLGQTLLNEKIKFIGNMKEEVLFYDTTLKTYETIPLTQAKAKRAEQSYPKNGTCVRKNETSWIDNFGKTREEIKELNIDEKGLEGGLDLSDFKNLEKLFCSYNCLTNLNVNNSELKELECFNNYLTQITYPTNLEQITYLNISDNNLNPSDLSIFKAGFSKEQTKEIFEKGSQAGKMKKSLKSEEIVIKILEPVKNVISPILVQTDVNLVMLNIFGKTLKFTEIEKVKELETVSSELQTLYLKQEKLNKSKFKQLTNKGKIKKIEQKIEALVKWKKPNEKEVPFIDEIMKKRSEEEVEIMIIKIANTKTTKQSSVSQMVPCYGISRDKEDNEPNNRPSAREVSGVVGEWIDEIYSKKDTQFYHQYKETEEYNTCQALTKLYRQYRDELYSKFCQKNNYDEGAAANEEFRRLLLSLFPQPDVKVNKETQKFFMTINQQLLNKLKQIEGLILEPSQLSPEEKKIKATDSPLIKAIKSRFKPETAEKETQTEISLTEIKQMEQDGEI
ncbi:290_t:CDS:10, partial [Scutellospora calospora]